MFNFGMLWQDLLNNAGLMLLCVTALILGFCGLLCLIAAWFCPAREEKSVVSTTPPAMEMSALFLSCFR